LIDLLISLHHKKITVRGWGIRRLHWGTYRRPQTS